MAERVLGAPLPIGFRAWDGSAAGPQDGTVLVIRSRDALRRLVWSPNELGLARAYVSGELDVEGDLATGLSQIWGLVRRGVTRRPRLSEVAKLALRLKVLGPNPDAPKEEARLRGALHTKSRDRDAISHHYDLSNDFYRLVLDPSMAYSCAYFTSEDESVAQAQHNKLDLVCRKLDLRPGMRLLDVGCGWGSMIIHAAKHYGVHATGVTISAQQRAHILGRIEAEGLAGRVEVRLQDYREVSGEPFDAISTIEMGEHVGESNYPEYASTLHRLLKPEGRLLLQQMSRGHNAPGGGAFIESYVAPDMHMRPVSATTGFLEGAGLEIRDVHALREHYVWTVRAWAQTLEERWDEVVALVGEGQARVWRLYLAGAALTFEEGRMGVDQILAVHRSENGRSGMPRVRRELVAR
ncbi:cyclopropane-fatty-acyl-phospholipid synthase family protein [Lentzea sp. NBC_00516]|uniref:cyclopropane-fatty-acyl-phospholipid synthase family protein n=1 Tax=Lentzea sp. NBC_00516 TaxID=2903582 RepID=UPI002E82195B|nr:cyclopropane-fatty-acyl-phospholipid synthase family protein [Lentzea sp. NBC_00516]WUD29921.1 cyclopropane-fatty-acyl-phospholipid synthase family protein [Lentzea sp. NBC_00516]